MEQNEVTSQRNTESDQNPEPIVMKFNYTPEKIMMGLSKERLIKLEEIWEDYPDGLELPLFTQLMVDSINCSEEEKYELVHGALKLFAEVDINGDHHMEWDEFMQYIIDAVMETSIQGTDQKQTVIEMIKEMKANKFKRFGMAYTPLDKSKHQNILLSAIYCPKPNLVYCFEKYSKELKFYTPDLKFKEKHKVPLRVEGFIMGIDFSESQLTFGCTASDSQLHFYLSTTKSVRYLKSFATPGIQTKIWFMNKHKTWITAGKDFKIRQWDPFRSDHLLDTFDLHTDEVMDVCELDIPFSIATCSFDKKIVIYSIQDRETLRVLEGDHITGVKRLAYQSGFGGHLVSVGHEVYANVWGPESLISEILIGKLKGHTKPIVDTKFICKSPFNVTMDVQNQVRIWDIKSLSCLQMIKGKITTPATGLVIINNDILWLYGKRIIQYDTYSGEENEGVGQQDQNPQEIYPIWAEFNTYYNNINVVNKGEIKLYDSNNGKLTKIHSGLVAGTKKVEITQFKLDLKHRKFYLADSQGLIKVYNIANGVILKDVNPEDDDEEEDLESNNSGDSYSDKMSRSSNNSDNKKNDKDDLSEDDIYKNKEITSMQLIWEEDYILMVCTDQKYLYVYDEDDTDESNLLRKITGAHTEEITIVKYDDYLSLVATGSVNGEIAIWDFEMSKLEGFCFGHTGDITGIEFLSPHPLMVSTSMDGTVCIWGMRPVSIHYKNMCLYRFSNISWKYNKDVLTSITRLQVYKKEMTGIKKHNRVKEGLFNASKYGNFNLNFLFQKIEQKLKNNMLTEHDKVYKHRNTLLSSLLRTEGLEETKDNVQNNTKNARKTSNNTFITETSQSLIDENYEENIDLEIPRIYVYIGDELGFLKVWDFTKLVKKIGFKQAPNYPKTKVSFNPKRSETIDCTKYATSLRNEYAQQLKSKVIKIPDIIEAHKAGIQIREIKGHKDCILCMNPIDIEQGGFITTSVDKKVRAWSLYLDLWGTLDQRTEQQDKNWNFPQEFKRQQKETEIEQVKELLDEVNLDLESPNKNIVINESDNDGEEQENDLKEKEMSSGKKLRQKFKQSQNQNVETLAEKIAGNNKKTHRQQYLEQINSNSVIYNIEKKIAEFNLKLKIMQMDMPLKYHGFAKNLEKTLDYQHSSRIDSHYQKNQQQIEQEKQTHNNFNKQSNMTLPRQKHSDIKSIGIPKNHKQHIQTIQQSPTRSTIKLNGLDGSSSKVLSVTKNLRSNSQLRQNSQKRGSIMSRNQESLERDKSAILMYGDLPNLRDKVFSLTNKKLQYPVHATPLRMRQNLHIDQEITNYNIEDKTLRSKILPATKLPPMQISSKYRNMSYETRDPSSRNISQMLRDKSMSNKKSNYDPLRNEYNSVRQQYGVGSKNQLGTNLGFQKNQYLTMDASQGGDAIHIAIDYIIDDNFNMAEENSTYKERKLKYFGQNSMLKLLHNEEKSKLSIQRKKLKSGIKATSGSRHVPSSGQQ